MNARETQSGVWVSIFRRKGGSGTHTRLFDELEQSKQTLLTSYMKPHELEVPIIGSLENADNWFALTTERIVWSIAGKRSELPIQSVRDATGDRDALQQGPRGKASMSSLKIITFDQDERTIRVEPGLPLFGVLHVLKNIGTRNRKRVGK